LEEHAIKRVVEDPVSTFSVDVDTSSYSYCRRLLKDWRLPSPEVVKTEEFLNYFDYDYPLPTDNETPFEPTAMVSDSPWNKGRKLMHIGIKGYDVEPLNRPFSNIVFLVDVSGSMVSTDKLPLAKESIEMLLGALQPGDYVSIVTYASGTKVELEPTAVTEKKKILSVLNSLKAGGATFGTGGIELAYEVAEKSFDKEAVNRIMVVTDGDFNIGLTDGEALKKYIEKKRDSGIFLSLLGFGMGNYKDTTMKALANYGNGVAAYIDSIEEAHKVMITEALSNIFPIAKDVKIQVEFNPAAVMEYRLVGYEKRILKREDFNNDKVDAGDIGSGHTVTALYEITPSGAKEAAALDELRYAEKRNLEEEDSKDQEYAFLKIRYKLPEEDTSKLITTPITHEHDEENIHKTTGANIIGEFKFATAVASYAQLLKGSKYTGDFKYEDVLKLAETNKGEDGFGYRREFIQLVRTTKRILQENKN
jgi:Ca-activated chloride channel family protein